MGEEQRSRLVDETYRHARRVDLDGGAVAVVERGSGPPVVLLHGIPLSSLSWRHTIDALGATAAVHALDMRGYGCSDKPPDADYSVPGLAGVVRDLIDRLDLTEVNLVGSSFGAAIAITFADLFPDRTGKLVLINPVCYPQRSHSATKLVRIGAVAAFARPALRRPGLGRRMLAGPLRNSYADPTLATPELIDAYHRQLVQAGGERAFLSTLRALDENEVARRVPGLDHDTLVIWGERDHVLPATDAARLARDLPHARIELLATAGHLPHEEEPERVNALLTAFLGSAGTKAPDSDPAHPEQPRPDQPIEGSTPRWR